MSKFKTDLRERCFRFSLSIISLCDSLTNKRSNWIIIDQLIRSSASIGANLVEARASSSRLEFKKFYEIALKSANETIYWLELLRETNKSKEAEINLLIDEVSQISKMLGSGVIRLKKNL